MGGSCWMRSRRWTKRGRTRNKWWCCLRCLWWCFRRRVRVRTSFSRWMWTEFKWPRCPTRWSACSRCRCSRTPSPSSLSSRTTTSHSPSWSTRRPSRICWIMWSHSRETRRSSYASRRAGLSPRPLSITSLPVIKTKTGSKYKQTCSQTSPGRHPGYHP